MKIKDFLNAECVNLATSKFQKCSKTLFTLLASGRRKRMINGTEWLVFIGWEDQVGSIITPRWTMWRSSPNPIRGVRCLFVQYFLTISCLFSMFTNLKYIKTILPAIFCRATPWCYFYKTLFWEQNSQPLQCQNSKRAPNNNERSI